MMMKNLVELSYVVVTLFLGVAAGFALMTMPGVGYLLGVVALGMIVVGLGALGARRYVNSMKDKIAQGSAQNR
jgi:hypothetical protein